VQTSTSPLSRLGTSFNRASPHNRSRAPPATCPATLDMSRGVLSSSADDHIHSDSDLQIAIIQTRVRPTVTAKLTCGNRLDHVAPLPATTRHPKSTTLASRRRLHGTMPTSNTTKCQFATAAISDYISSTVARLLTGSRRCVARNCSRPASYTIACSG